MTALHRFSPLLAAALLAGCAAASAAPPAPTPPTPPTPTDPPATAPVPSPTAAVTAGPTLPPAPTPTPAPTATATAPATATLPPSPTVPPVPTATKLAAGPAIAVTSPAPTATVTAPRPAASPAPIAAGVLPVITARHRQIYRGSVANGKDLRMFTIVGDCNSQPAVYLRRVVTGEYDAAGLPPSLRATVDHFSASFPRVSLAAGGGFTSASMNDPVWADGALCGTKQTPFECEIWVSRASIVFIQIGTGDQYLWQDFERHYRPLIEHALSKSVLPVLLTKADDLETRSGGAPPQFINGVVRRLAREYDIPLIDFWAATRGLPNNGLIDEGDLDFHLSREGMDLHLTLTLQVLDAIWR